MSNLRSYRWRLLMIPVVLLISVWPLATHAGHTAENYVQPTPPPGGAFLVENVGQFDPRVRFQLRWGSSILWLTDGTYYGAHGTYVNSYPYDYTLYQTQYKPDRWMQHVFPHFGISVPVRLVAYRHNMSAGCLMADMHVETVPFAELENSRYWEW